MQSKHVAKVSRRHDATAITADLVYLAQRLNFPLEDLFRRAGISDESWGGLRPQLSLHRQQLSRLFEAIVIRAEQESCHRGLSRPALPEHGFQMLCFALIACPTLGDAIEMGKRFFEIFTDGETNIGVTQQGERCLFVMRSTSDRRDCPYNALVTIAGLHSFAQLFSWLVGQDLDIDDIAIWHDIRAEIVWRGSPLVGQLQTARATNGFSFDAALLAQRVIRSYAELVELIQFFPFDLMPPDYDGWLLAERVKAYCQSALRVGTIPRLPEIAAVFNISLTTLRRRLSEENRSFQRIKDSCRFELAQSMLTTSPATLSQIADQLAFTDVANFRRSFRRWTGYSPDAYRRGQMQAGSARLGRVENDQSVDKNDLP
ncbi:helix-turn-helix domain-containing protein [Sphingobium sp. WCS2017Hpa-17]|uniref:helix-turn-helix domain-containing protein n=1 Tax=Sphingobium sp. WCS2017Hpa-17 TaxID=3073638 RepID=UPI00288AB9E0|nr:helix-turn-helix domain-containing protein [Sphingobium sp. WCS2017Hpa-17]